MQYDLIIIQIQYSKVNVNSLRGIAENIWEGKYVLEHPQIEGNGVLFRIVNFITEEKN